MKKLFVIFVITCLLLSFGSSVLATKTLSQIIGSADNSASLGGKIVTVISTIGGIVSIVMLSYIGIKYMLASAAQKADLKTSLIPYLVGAVLLGAASVIAPAIVKIGG